jgi:hypothetical protein
MKSAIFFIVVLRLFLLVSARASSGTVAASASPSPSPQLHPSSNPDVIHYQVTSDTNGLKTIQEFAQKLCRFELGTIARTATLTCDDARCSGTYTLQSEYIDNDIVITPRLDILFPPGYRLAATNQDQTQTVLRLQWPPLFLDHARTIPIPEPAFIAIKIVAISKTLDDQMTSGTSKCFRQVGKQLEAIIKPFDRSGMLGDDYGNQGDDEVVHRQIDLESVDGAVLGL